MGLFDHYQPDPPLTCPVCHTELVEWQGKDGPNALFVWSQGVASPIDQRVPAEVQLEPGARAALRLPKRFTIYSYGCERHQPVDADCETSDGVWRSATLKYVPGGKTWRVSRGRSGEA